MANILIVDDSESIRKFVSESLTSAGHNAYVAASGGDALKVAKRKGLDLILSDLHMPGMSGIGLVNKLRRLEGCEHLPILMLTSEQSEDKKIQARKFGATGWISKPFTEQTLVDVVNKYLS